MSITELSELLTNEEILSTRRCYQGTPVIAVCNLALRLRAENERLRQELSLRDDRYGCREPAADEWGKVIGTALKCPRLVRELAEAEAALADIGRIPDVADRAGVGDGSVRDAVIALTGALATARKDALEEAAKVCEERYTVGDITLQKLSWQCAAEIRALAQKESGNG